jgi:superfamily I DNA/RNA helicase
MDAERMWTVREYEAWSEWLTAKGLMEHGAKTLAEEWLKLYPDHTMPEELQGFFLPEGYEELMRVLADGPVETARWWAGRVQAQKRNVAAFVASIVARQGAAALEAEPRVTVGTIHSVKGGEADVVYLMPDVSPKWMEQWYLGGVQRDDVLRLFYVGMTRCREELVVLGGARRGLSIPLPLV